ncbi:MAG: spore germination protein [Firmicutes bacterium]|nr:spore germination protein [Bacillota bacterium]
MSHKPVLMGVAEGLTLVCIATFATSFLSAWSSAIDRATTALWMLPLTNGCCGIIILYLLLYVLNHTSGDLCLACEELLGTLAARLIIIYYISVSFLDAGLLLRQFAENTLITALPEFPFELIIGWYALIIVIITYIGIESIARAGYMILLVIILSMLTVLVMLSSQYQWLYLAPWNGPGFAKVILTGIQSTGAIIGIIIPAILATSFQNIQTIKKAVLYGLGISSLIKSLTQAAFIATFGTEVAREKVLPFYELARLVYINRYIQRIESLIILAWVITGILNIAIAFYIGLYLLGRLFNLSDIRPFIIPIFLIITELAMLPNEITAVIFLHSKAHFLFYNIGALVIPTVLFFAAMLRTRRQKAC